MNSLIDVLEFEIARAESYGFGIAPGDKSGLQSPESRERNAGAIMSAEAFGLHNNRLLAFDRYRKEENLAVGQNAIHIE